MKSAFLATILIGLFCLISAAAQNSAPSKSVSLALGETIVKINIYENLGARITFVVVHHNEQTGLNLAKEIVAEKGGRLIELISLNDAGKPARFLKFRFQNAEYRIDPNRIFTPNGRSAECSRLPAAAIPAVERFADDFLKIMLPAAGKKLRKGERALVAVHNNSNIDDADDADKNTDLTAFAYLRGGAVQHPLAGRYSEQVAGVFLANDEPDEDNFFFVSTPEFLNFLGGRHFNVVLQKDRTRLAASDCKIDDGSLSVFAGQQNIPYLNVEADIRTGAARQREMIEAVYELLQAQTVPRRRTAASKRRFSRR